MPDPSAAQLKGKHRHGLEAARGRAFSQHQSAGFGQERTLLVPLQKVSGWGEDACVLSFARIS